MTRLRRMADNNDMDVLTAAENIYLTIRGEITPTNPREEDERFRITAIRGPKVERKFGRYSK